LQYFIYQVFYLIQHSFYQPTNWRITNNAIAFLIRQVLMRVILLSLPMCFKRMAQLLPSPQPCVVPTHWDWRTRRVSNPVQSQQVNSTIETVPHEGNSSAADDVPFSNDVSRWFSWARQEQIVLAMSLGVVYAALGEAVAMVVFDAALSGAGTRISSIIECCINHQPKR
jgi:hypothetical protein